MQPTEQPGADAAPKAAPFTPEQLAPHFPQLEILECLGRGGMGVVYKARQKTLNRLVALKLLAPERVTDPKFAERFAREAQALAALNHPSIVTIYDFGKVTLNPASQLSTLNAQPLFFLLMEFVDGVNLRQAMRAGRFTPEQALAVVPPVCEALQYAHEHGIVHRDIKPENLLLDKDGRVKIADFGIAKMLGEESDTGVPPVSTEATGGTPVPHSIDAGTPQYMAPEQRDHQRTDHRADIYSLGVVLYEMLTGELPADKLEPPSRKVQIDVRLDEIVLRALERTPELRYQTAAEFRTQVETMVAPVPPVGRERRETFTWNAGALFGSALGMSIWMPVAALLSDWNAAGIVLSFTSTGVIVGTALWLWNARHRRPAIEGYLLLLAAGFIATFVFLVGAQSLGLTLRSSVPGGITVSPMNFGWTLGLYFLMWWWFMRRYEEPESPAASGSGSPHGRGSGEVQHRESPHSPQTPPRMSRTAIVGVCWAAFAALAFMALFPLWSMTAPLGSPTVHPSGLLKFILAVVGVVAAAAPFGTTILGWVATSQIRQSAGRLRGMGLAVFDGLVFPLLVLDGFIIWLARTLTRLLVDFYANEAMHQRALADPEHIHLPFVTRLANDLLHSGPSTALFMVATGIAVLVVDFLIIRAVWRAVNGTASAATPRPPQQPESQSRWQGWDVWVIGLSLTAFGALWLDRLSRAQLYRPFQSLDIVLPSALATVIVLAGAAFLWMLAKNLKSTSGSRFTSWRRLSGQAIVPTIAIVILLRAWVLQAFVIPVNSMAPELPAGSRVLVWKLTRQFAPGDIIAHKHGDLVWVSRVVREEKEQLVLQRNEWPEEKLPRADVIGKVISVLWRGSGAVDRSRYPKAETISGANGTVLVHHDNVDLHYALFHANGAWSTVADSQNTHSLLWMETGSMRIAKGRTFSYLRKSLSPDSLNVNGEDFDLRKGRVLVLHDDGTLDQLDIAVTLSVARNPVALGAVIEGMSDAANGRLPAAQTQMRSAIVSTL
ncbi:MAG: protein kinase, partial [Chthoniobacteraceae bacterium]